MLLVTPQIEHPNQWILSRVLSGSSVKCGN